ncbi:peptidylprolyl isomerase [Asticcacaulis sp. EMRT-3]|uniref:peptidylprolyl isomerase n=1 Tax=Asticcacaulis sp. EMRT-3 TaxID=3040349 RepID=UPI0024AF98F2|nr:peptidylprolyl isomerase [Asticcacaulis sp. EMRT-3]MDI7774576.1 peptidylprolyl isomerase [Asticcacaulis sp. EMRT-3]
MTSNAAMPFSKMALRHYVCAGAFLALAAATAVSAQGLTPAPLPDSGSAAQDSQPAFSAATEAPQLPQLGEGVLVSVNNDMITSYDLKQRMLLLIVTSGVQVTQDNYAAFQKQALSSLIDEKLEKQEMDHWKVKVTPKEVDDEIARMAQQSNLTSPQLLAELKRVGVEPATLRAQISSEIGWQELVGGRYHSNAAVGSTQVDALMDKVIADGQKPQYLVSEIFIDPAAAGSMANAQQGAQQLYDQIVKKAAPFQAVARQFSNAPSAANGGDEGWLVSGSIDPAIENALKSLKPGEMSPPVMTKDGAYILLLRRKTDGNADMVFHMKQAAIPLSANATADAVSNAEAQLSAFRNKVDSCDAVDDLNGKAPGDIQLTDLGEVQLSTLTPEYVKALRPLKEGESTTPLRNSQYMNVVYVCGRQLAGDHALTREQLEDNLVNQRLAMLGKRYLRELRSSATIVNH